MPSKFGVLKIRAPNVGQDRSDFAPMVSGTATMRRPFVVLLLALDAASSLQFGTFRNALPAPSGGEHFALLAG